MPSGVDSSESEGILPGRCCACCLFSHVWLKLDMARMQVANKVRRRGQLGPNGKTVLPPNQEQPAFRRQHSQPLPAVRQASL